MISFLAYALLNNRLPPVGVPCIHTYADKTANTCVVHAFAEAWYGERDCAIDGFEVLLKNVGSLWVTPFVFPSSIYMYRFFLGWVGLFYMLSALSCGSMGEVELEEALYEANVDLMAGCLFLCLMIVNSIAHRLDMDLQEKRRFLFDLEYIKATRKMFDILTLMVPEFVLLDLLEKPGDTIAVHAEKVSILFVVFSDFDRIARKLAPEQLLLFLNGYFTQFDSVCTKHKVMKIETVSEEYVCAVGVDPSDSEEANTHGHTVLLGKLLNAAIDILHLPLQNRADETVSLRMGLHTGPVVGGVVGQKLPRFRLFGDTINTAARMMQRGLVGEVQFGRQTLDDLPDWSRECVIPRGKVEMKGKGLVDTFLLDHRELRSRRRQVVRPDLGGRARAATNVTDDTSQGRSNPEIPASSASSHGVISRLLSDSVGVKQPTTLSGDLHKSGSFDIFLKHISSPAITQADKQELDRDFQKWFHETCFLSRMGPRLFRAACMLVGLTLLEYCYLFSCKRLMKFPEATLDYFMACRVAAFLMTLAWLAVHQCTSFLKRWPLTAQWCMMLTSYSVALIMLTSYMFLPYLFGVKTHTASVDSEFPLTGVSTNVLFLMWVPETMFLARVHPIRFRPALVFTILTILPIFVKVALSKAFIHANVDWTDCELYGADVCGGKIMEVVTPRTYIMLMALPLINAFFEERFWRERCTAQHHVTVSKMRVEGILDTLMPPMVVDELRQHALNELRRNPCSSGLPSHLYKKATVVQSDITGFTNLASTRQPAEVVRIVGELFGLYDSLTETFEVYKVETVGDAYIAARAEVPLTASCLPLAVVRFGLAVVQATHTWSGGKDAGVNVRVGVHFGECVGGIVGVDMQRYHLFGELMHVVEILEATSLPGYVQVSTACKEAVEAQLAMGLESPRAGKNVVPKFNGLHFESRAGEELTSSKGECFSHTLVGGPTFLVSEQGAGAV